MTTFKNNPFSILTDIVNREFPDLVIEVYIGEGETDGVNTFGCTIFPENQPIKIEIHHALKMSDAIEVYAHELAHAIAGKDHTHDSEWAKVFNMLYDLFGKELEKIIDSEDNKAD